MTATKIPKHGAYYIIRGAEYDLWWAYQDGDKCILFRVQSYGYLVVTNEDLIEVDRWGNEIECPEQTLDNLAHDTLARLAAERAEERRIDSIASALLSDVNIGV